MKHIRHFRVLAVALIVALLAAALPAGPALAANIFVKPIKAKVNDVINVYGYGFSPGATIDIYFSSDATQLGFFIDTQVLAYERVKQITSDNVGQIDTNFPVPANLTSGGLVRKVQGGTYYIYTTNALSKLINGVVQFTVERTGEISVDKANGPVGTEVKLTGTNFAEGEGITIKYDGTKLNIKSGDTRTKAGGEFTSTIVVPASTAGGHVLSATGDVSGSEATITFTVEPSITLNRENGVPGDTVNVSGTGFGGSISYSIAFDSAVLVSTKVTEANGSFEATFQVPQQDKGSHEVLVTDGNGVTAKAAFTVATTGITLNPTSGYSGLTVTVTGAGFQASKSISINFENEVVKNISSDDKGNFSTTFTVPARNAGTYKVRASDGTNRVEADFTIASNATISPVTSTASPGRVGSELIISGVGFIPGRTVNVTYDGAQLATATVSTSGNFSATLKVPPSKAGNHTVSVTDGANTRQFTFVMESTPPSVPQPRAPAPGSKTKAEAYFDWIDVSDPSGVTYTLQIANAQDFSASSTVLQKTGLVKSEYTLLPAESLKSQNTPYYWHVKAVDGAGNESPWSSTGSFNVGFVFSLTPTLLTVILVIFAAALGAIGFWVVRKRSHR